jgi:predicted GIY-YIG superfamily endonuclease
LDQVASVTARRASRDEAISGRGVAREKQIKAGSRQKKSDLINRLNPEWRDLKGDL